MAQESSSLGSPSAASPTKKSQQPRCEISTRKSPKKEEEPDSNSPVEVDVSTSGFLESAQFPSLPSIKPMRSRYPPARPTSKLATDEKSIAFWKKLSSASRPSRPLAPPNMPTRTTGKAAIGNSETRSDTEQLQYPRDSQIPGNGEDKSTEAANRNQHQKQGQRASSSRQWARLGRRAGSATRERLPRIDEEAETFSKVEQKRTKPWIIGTHTHTSLPQIQPPFIRVDEYGPSRKKLPGFFWQLDIHGSPCAKVDCNRRCNLWVGSSVTCPRCGPFSETRYCTKEHLYDDVKAHWLICGQVAFEHPCLETSVPMEFREGPPLIPSRHKWDNPERHRQAVYHATSKNSDYVIFADWEQLAAAKQPQDTVLLRCSPKVVRQVVFDEPQEKDRFRRILSACLFSESCLVPYH